MKLQITVDVLSNLTNLWPLSKKEMKKERFWISSKAVQDHIPNFSESSLDLRQEHTGIFMVINHKGKWIEPRETRHPLETSGFSFSLLGWYRRQSSFNAKWRSIAKWSHAETIWVCLHLHRTQKGIFVRPWKDLPISSLLQGVYRRVHRNPVKRWRLVSCFTPPCPWNETCSHNRHTKWSAMKSKT